MDVHGPYIGYTIVLHSGGNFPGRSKLIETEQI